ncbi:F0F1 ATP synthase subunit B [Microcella frigidaquae]|uniref:ATP synthase subunit b n=1 Tax=Microcella frigidaquae TaxID=424758 RepID=A0A840XCS0_9MICO|nr:F0F1 ATP synthase subunit B [Microcella frigidaquae]MBB5618835.1 F-type H+-transporting ATPase subunit b [Microcella frigidaquae]NHN44936.1 F0F1 ATP synthase subunit B [Microcella frigidaquae]
MLAELIVAAEETPNPLLPAWYDIVYSLIPFILVLLLFWRVVLPRMQKTLDERAALIEGGIAKAESAQAEAQAALEQYNALLAEGRAEAAKIREQARAEGAAILAELKESAQAEAARITANAQLQIEAERQAALVSLRAEVGSLALDLASGVIGETLSDDKRASALVDRFLAELESDTASKKAAK